MKKEAKSHSRQHDIDSDSPVLPPMATMMKVDLAINEKSQVWLFHDKRLPPYLKWVEYDAVDNHMTFITNDGQVQDLGMKIPDNMRLKLSHSTEIYTIHMVNEAIQDCGIVPLLVRNVTMN